MPWIDSERRILMNNSIFGKGAITLYHGRTDLPIMLPDDSGVGQTLLTALTNFIVPLIQGDTMERGEYPLLATNTDDKIPGLKLVQNGHTFLGPRLREIGLPSLGSVPRGKICLIR